ADTSPRRREVGVAGLETDRLVAADRATRREEASAAALGVRHIRQRGAVGPVGCGVDDRSAVRLAPPIVRRDVKEAPRSGGARREGKGKEEQSDLPGDSALAVARHWAIVLEFRRATARALPR